MRRLRPRTLAPSHLRAWLMTALVVSAGALVWGQGRNLGFEWPATNADAQRTNWMRLDQYIAPATLSDFRLQWQEKLPVTARAGHVLSQGVTANGMQVFTPTSFVTGISNVVFALDNDTGHPNFVKQFAAICRADCAVPRRYDRIAHTRRQPRADAARIARTARCASSLPGRNRSARRGSADGYRPTGRRRRLAGRPATSGGPACWRWRRRIDRREVQRRDVRRDQRRCAARLRSQLPARGRASRTVPAGECSVLGSDRRRRESVYVDEPGMRWGRERRLGHVDRGERSAHRHVMAHERRKPGGQSGVHDRWQAAGGGWRGSGATGWLRQRHRRARPQDASADRLVHRAERRLRHDTGRDARRYAPARGRGDA